MADTLYLGVDVGSTTTKAVLVDAEGNVHALAACPSGADFTLAARTCRQRVLESAGAAVIARTVSTGYGRDSVEAVASRATEITCHARGCFAVHPSAMTIIDIGGQDNKVIAVAQDGSRRDFKMNRKCAAGTGAFLEEIAARLDTPIESLDALGRKATGDVTLGSFCTVFAKTELLRLIARGTPIPDIALAAYRSVVQRILEMDPLTGDVVMTGGVVAHHPIVAELVSTAIGHSVHVPDHAQFTGAHGAALLAIE